MNEEIKNEESIEDILSQFTDGSEVEDEDVGEESLEDLFNQFIEALKNLPQEDKDKMYENLKGMEDDSDNN